MLRRFAANGIGIFAAVGLVALFGAFAFQGKPTEPKGITVTGNDYAFTGIPERVPAGRLFFAFVNKGQVQHELSIRRLQPGISPYTAIARLKTGGPRKGLFGGAAVLIVTGAGQESPRTRVVIDARSGEQYIVVCTLKDSPEAPTHMMLGMYTTFRVE